MEGLMKFEIYPNSQNKEAIRSTKTLVESDECLDLNKVFNKKDMYKQIQTQKASPYATY